MTCTLAIFMDSRHQGKSRELCDLFVDIKAKVFPQSLHPFLLPVYSDFLKIIPTSRIVENELSLRIIPKVSTTERFLPVTAASSDNPLEYRQRMYYLQSYEVSSNCSVYATIFC